MHPLDKLVPGDIVTWRVRIPNVDGDYAWEDAIILHRILDKGYENRFVFLVAGYTRGFEFSLDYHLHYIFGSNKGPLTREQLLTHWHPKVREFGATRE